MRKTFYLCSLIFVSVFFIPACKTNNVTVSILKPAEIYVPSHIKKVTVINRSLPAKGDGNQFANVVEGLLSGEGIFYDKYASRNTVAGLADGLANSPRFYVNLPDKFELKATGGATFPPPLNWNEVKKICETYNSDGLILLEVFDSNTRKNLNTAQRTEKKDGKEITYTEFITDLDIEINAGWRIYDPENSIIVDETMFTDRKTFSASGRTKKESENNLPDQSIATEDAGYFAGRQYAKRISPSRITETRKYYVKANDDFVKAKYKVKINMWEEAAEIWKKYVNDPDPETAGRACYNMAVASEVLGKYEIALDWAKKAYSDYRLKSASAYVRTLNRRIEEEKRLKRQMSE